MGRQILRAYDRSRRRGETRVCFVRIALDPEVRTYMVGRGVLEVRRRMESGAGRVLLPTRPAVPCGLMLAAMLGAISATEIPTACQMDSPRRRPVFSPPSECATMPSVEHVADLDQTERDARAAAATTLLEPLSERGVVAVATTFVDNSGVARVKAVPLGRLPHLAAWGVGSSVCFDP